MTDSDDAKSRKRRFYGKKTFWLACLSVIVAICARYAWVKLNDKPLTILPVDSADAQPDYAYGTGIDFRQRYNLRQDASVLPADENGWKLILQALGPLALREEYKAKTIPWDRFPTDDSSKQWFHEKWTPLCEKFGIDPTVPPTFLTRLDLQNYLVKNGITGEEEDSFDLDDSGESDEESSGFITSDWLHNYKPRKTYWENYEEKTGRVDSGQALDCCLKLWEKPWTRDDYPVAARWIEENADLYDVYSKAVRMPRFACWHFISDKQADCWFDLSLAPDVQFLREIARSFFTRANYRIGMADYSGAIDDVESILLLAQSVFENSENCCLTYALIGAAIMGFAAEIQLDGGASEIRPTQEEFARLADVWNVYFGKLDFEEATRNALKGERDVLFLPLNQDYLSMLRNGSLREVFEEISFLDFSLTQDDSERPDSFLMSGNVFLRGSFDDGAYMAELEKLYNELVIEEKTGIEDWSSIKPKSREAKLAKQLFLCLGAPAGALRVSLERVACFVNMQLITIAFLRYQTEHGALPPAFTVDEEGNPLHSWRVLILPYLGEDNKALYDQIKLDEPWDSDYNKQFHARAPKLFQCPSNKKCEEGSTTYSVILGEDALFDASGVGKDLTESRRREGLDTNSQALVVERERPVCWMKPDEELDAQSFRESAAAMDVDPDSGHSEGMNVGHANGSISFFPSSTAERSVFDLYTSGVPNAFGASFYPGDGDDGAD